MAESEGVTVDQRSPISDVMSLLRSKGMQPTNENVNRAAQIIAQGMMVPDGAPEPRPQPKAEPIAPATLPQQAATPQRRGGGGGGPLPLPPDFVPPPGNTSAAPSVDTDESGGDWLKLIAAAAAAGIPLAAFLAMRKGQRDAPTVDTQARALTPTQADVPRLPAPNATQALPQPAEQGRLGAPEDVIRLPGSLGAPQIANDPAMLLAQQRGLPAPDSALPGVRPIPPGMAQPPGGPTMQDPLGGVRAPAIDIGANNPIGPSSAIPPAPSSMETAMQKAMAPAGGPPDLGVPLPGQPNVVVEPNIPFTPKRVGVVPPRSVPHVSTRLNLH